MAHQFSEHASQAVSRGSVAALIPLEKHATLARPLSQNAPKPARIFTGTDIGGVHLGKRLSYAQFHTALLFSTARKKTRREASPENAYALHVHSWVPLEKEHTAIYGDNHDVGERGDKVQIAY